MCTYIEVKTNPVRCVCLTKARIIESDKSDVRTLVFTCKVMYVRY